ncbi:RNA-directed DNA polymerase [Aphanothece hegewaldii]|nr:RNA-directed DNA polymerase [Aphanothece hegewaldii]
MLKVEDLLGKGYFPKELPPPFTSQKLAHKYSSINSLWASIFNALSRSDKKVYRDSRCLSFSIPKVGFSRRQISLPNPLHQSILSDSICKNWSEIEKIYLCSPLSTSRPVVDTKGSRSVKNRRNYKEFKEGCILNSYAHLSLMRTDISRYYPTIYTHIIPWAIHGKTTAKENRDDYSLLGNILDRDVRNTQSGQTMGIPIGPDTSLIISEIIACKIDEELISKIGDLNGARYYDDYFLFFSDYAKAEKTLKCLQSILAAYHLDINEEKTRIERFPAPFESSWSIFLSRFEFRDGKTSQATDLYRYFSLAFESAQKHPNDSVLKYAVKRLEYIEILPENWRVFESLLLKSALSEPSTLPEVVKILISNESYVSKDRVEKLAQEIILIHCFKAHSFEVSWSLWLLRSFKINLDVCIAEKVIASGDPISVLIVLDMRNCGLISGSLDISSVELDLTSSSLFDEKWLLTYESVKKGWLKPPDPGLLSSNEYFNLLSKEDIEFYAENQQLEKIEINKKSGASDSKEAPEPKEETIPSVEEYTSDANLAITDVVTLY